MRIYAGYLVLLLVGILLLWAGLTGNLGLLLGCLLTPDIVDTSSES